MVEILSVLSSTRSTEMDEEFGNQEVVYLTLGHTSPASGNRFYVRISGDDAHVDWHEGDKVMVELSLCAYKHQGHWHMSHHGNSLRFVEVMINKDCEEYAG